MKKEVKSKNIYSIISMIAVMFFLRFDSNFYLIGIVLIIGALYFIGVIIKSLNIENENKRKFKILTSGSLSISAMCGAVGMVLMDFGNNRLAIVLMLIGFIQLFIVGGVVQKYKEDEDIEDGNLSNKLS